MLKPFMFVVTLAGALAAAALFQTPPPPATPNDLLTAQVAEANARAAEANGKAVFWNTFASGKLTATLNVNGVSLGTGGGTGGGTTPPAGSFKKPDATYTDAPIPAGLLLPASDPTRQSIASATVDPNSAAYIATITAGMRTSGLHPDFGSAIPNGIPYTLIPAGGSSKVTYYPVAIDAPGSAPNQSDPGPYPIPPGCWQENGPFPGPAGDGNDHHALIVSVDDRKLYELYQPYFDAAGKLHAYSASVFDMTKPLPSRPDGWTSADAAGLPILPLLVRHDEALAGTIPHALRFTINPTFQGFVHPATHFASTNTGTAVLPMGARLRLKASRDISKFDPVVQVWLKALQTYGMIVSDNGTNLFAQGTPDAGWNDGIMHQVQTGVTVNGVQVTGPIVPGDLEVVTIPLPILTTRGP